MNWRTFWCETRTGFVLRNIVAAVVIVGAILTVVLIWLRHYTQHNQEITMPDITGLYVEEATITLNAEGLHLVIIDSTYSQKTPLGTIVEQNPKIGSKVKEGRVVYAVQNANFRKPVFLPELRDLSLRQAQATLQTLGIQVSDIQYEPSTYKDIVLDVRTGEQSIPAGGRVDEGSAVTLVVGKGRGTAEVTVPSLRSKTLAEARSWLLAEMLTLGVVEYDVPPTAENKDLYIVYSQSPASGTVVVEGTEINVKLSQDIEKTITADNEEDEEDFF